MNINLVLLLYGQPLCDCTGGNIPDFKVIFICYCGFTHNQVFTIREICVPYCVHAYTWCISHPELQSKFQKINEFSRWCVSFIRESVRLVSEFNLKLSWNLSSRQIKMFCRLILGKRREKIVKFKTNEW